LSAARSRRAFGDPRPLDRPPWEACVIEGPDTIPGIAKGSLAFHARFQRAAIDADCGTQVLNSIHAYSPEEQLPARAPARQPAGGRAAARRRTGSG
jgi:hypothetical protein